MSRLTPLPVPTDPASVEPLFVIRSVEDREALDHVATPQELVALPENPLAYFEARGADGDGFLDAVAGDTLRLATIPEWLQADAPYADCDFVVGAVESLASGTAPQVLTGNLLKLPTYAFTNADIGRWFTLSGFATSGYNGRARVIAVAGNTAVIDKSVTTNEVGGAWAAQRLRIATDAGPSLEPRYFPTRVAGRAWTLYTSLGSVRAAGSDGRTFRADPAAPLFRDRRVTSVLPSQKAALDLVAATRAGVRDLQAALAVEDTSFLGVQTHDYPEAP